MEKYISAIIETVAESGHEVLAVYDRGSKLYGLATESSDRDILVIVDTKIADLVINTTYADMVKVPEYDLDLIIMDEYRLASHLGKSILNTIECFFAEPLYVADSFLESSYYLSDFALELLTRDLKALYGNLYGYFRSYSKEPVPTVGSEFAGKRWALAYRAHEVSNYLLLHGEDGSKEDITKLLVPTGAYSDYLRKLKSTTAADVEIVKELASMKAAFISMESELLAAVREQHAVPDDTVVLDYYAYMQAPTA